MEDNNATAVQARPTSLTNLEALFVDRLFEIPDYQRGYAWTNRQLTDFRKDIENLFDRDASHRHYTGTIVASKRKDADALDIVDGQQRLTTMVILLKAIHDRDPERYTHIMEQYILRGRSGDQRLVLKPNQETALYYTDLIVNGVRTAPRKFKSHENILAADTFFRTWLASVPDRVDEILTIVTQRFGFIFFMPEHDKEIGIMFEVINNRGKELSQLEKMKNYFIYYATVKDRRALHDEINERWRALLENLSLANLTNNAAEDSFLRNCYLVFFEVNKERSWDVYAQMKANFEVAEDEDDAVDAAVEKITAFVRFVSSAARHCAYFYRDTEYLKDREASAAHIEVDRCLRYLRCHPVNASIMPLYLAIMHKSSGAEQTAALLKVLEVLNFRLYVLPRVLPRADSKQGELFELAYKYFHCEDGAALLPDLEATPHMKLPLGGSTPERLQQLMKDLVLHYCPETKVVEALSLDMDENENYHRWNGTRFFLASYEEDLNADMRKTYDIQEVLKKRDSFGILANDYLSVEHIWAQKNLAAEYPPDDREKRRLGNLVLLGLPTNTSLSNEAIPDKVKELTDRNSENSGALGLLQVRELAESLLDEATRKVEESRKYKNSGYYHDLAAAISDARETALIRFALKRWKLDVDDFYRFKEVDTFKAKENKTKECYFLAPERATAPSVPEDATH